MRRLKSRVLIAAIGLIPATVILASACSSGGEVANKAGANQPVVLRMANVNAGVIQTPEIGYFTKRLSELSHGEMSVKITVRVGGMAMSAEQQVVKDVADGSFDLGYTGTSMFDTVGVTSFQALSAPMLIDNYPLENAVIRSALPGRMMAGLAKLNVTGLAVFGDGMRKPMGVKHPILSPADWHGITFGTYLSKAQEDAIRALGATPGPGFADARDQALSRGDLQGFDLNLGVYQQAGEETNAPYIAANVNLWPRTLALFANPGRLARLPESQRRILYQAAADAAAHSTGLVQDETKLVREVCQQGSRFATASAADVAGLRQRLVPVYTELEASPQTRTMIEQIMALKRSTPAGPALAVPAACTGAAASQPATAAARLNGTYRWTITQHDALTASDQDPADYPLTFTVTLKDGTWKMSHTGAETEIDTSGDTYTIQGNRIRFHWGAGPALTFTFSIDSTGDLHLKPVQPMAAGDAFIWTTRPWAKIG